MTLDKYLTIAECLPKEQEPSEDAISRQAAIEALKNLEDLQGRNVFTKNGLYPWNVIAQLPPVNPQEPKTGHWILTIEDWNKWTCSECGFSERTDIHVTLGYRFCPKCGAKMEEQEQYEDKT